MTHPLVYMLAHRPKMLVVHAQAYADLLSADASLALRQAKLKALLGIMTLCMTGVSFVLTGVATMLWGVLPAGPMVWPWIMLAAPGASWLMTLALAWATYRTPVSHALSEFKRQVYTDMALCKELSVP
jgi:hypothetical protein